MTVLLVRTVFPASIGFVFLPHHSGLENGRAGHGRDDSG